MPQTPKPSGPSLISKGTYAQGDSNDKIRLPRTGENKELGTKTTGVLLTIVAATFGMLAFWKKRKKM